jgi:hypothetical protein
VFISSSRLASTDSYFAVTGHWIEEHAPGEWTLEHALLGFAQMNCAHNRGRLGQVLYKICSRLEVVHKVSTLILHAVSIRSLLLHTFQHRSVISHAITPRTMTRCWKNLHAAIRSKLGKILTSIAVKSGKWPFYVRVRILTSHPSRCLAHIVNLATQAFISARSKSRYYNGNPDDDHLPDDLGAVERDEIGIVRAICIKVYTVSLITLNTNLPECRHAHHHNAKRRSRIFKSATMCLPSICSST